MTPSESERHNVSNSDQAPVQSEHHGKSTADEVLSSINLEGKTAIVTGGYSGIGLETVRSLASKGVSVIVPVRSPEKAAAALSAIEGDVKTAPMDLADLSTVRNFAESMTADLSGLDLLESGHASCAALLGDISVRTR
jgi:NAD(P)-dependent dehydrogenase (short-subunit alcohol dehydrogenase family)